MFTLSVGVGELILRAVIVYVFLFVLLRLLGKRHVGELAAFDLVVLLILSEGVQNALVGDDKSVIGAVITTSTLIGLSALAGYVAWRSKKAERFLEGTPRVLVRNGKVCDDVLAHEQITRAELIEALRREGCTVLTKVRFAVLEIDGSITIGLRAEPQGSADAQ
jgi:uncharacterized membrane protein YcaP (DUF421 family)